jgi:hypothetical protein
MLQLFFKYKGIIHMPKNLPVFLLIMLLSSCMHKTTTDFFTKLTQHCGKSYDGESVFPDDPGKDFAGKKLNMSIAECSDNEIRVPFKVGDNTSRTWIISRTKNGLLLKHDHRHTDGTPDEITMYGGYADAQSTEFMVNFAADEETAKMLPEAKTNVWTLSFDEKQSQFVYSLKRHNKPRYKAIFDISK